MRAILVDKDRDDQSRIAAARAIIPLVPKEEVVFRIYGPEDETQWALMLKEALTDLLPRALLEKVMTSIQARNRAYRDAGGIVRS